VGTLIEYSDKIPFITLVFLTQSFIIGLLIKTQAIERKGKDKLIAKLIDKGYEEE